jgi:hypothetical protein
VFGLPKVRTKGPSGCGPVISTPVSAVPEHAGLQAPGGSSRMVPVPLGMGAVVELELPPQPAAKLTPSRSARITRRRAGARSLGQEVETPGEGDEHRVGEPSHERDDDDAHLESIAQHEPEHTPWDPGVRAPGSGPASG